MDGERHAGWYFRESARVAEPDHRGGDRLGRDDHRAGPQLGALQTVENDVLAGENPVATCLRRSQRRPGAVLVTVHLLEHRQRRHRGAVEDVVLNRAGGSGRWHVGHGALVVEARQVEPQEQAVR